jgi:hypothetical protein
MGQAHLKILDKTTSYWFGRGGTGTRLGLQRRSLPIRFGTTMDTDILNPWTLAVIHYTRVLE